VFRQLAQAQMKQGPFFDECDSTIEAFLMKQAQPVVPNFVTHQIPWARPGWQKSDGPVRTAQPQNGAEFLPKKEPQTPFQGIWCDNWILPRFDNEVIEPA
jgi:hypothetical protein